MTQANPPSAGREQGPRWSRTLGRAALLGLVTALAIAGAALLFQGGATIVRGPPCAGLSQAECELERDVALPWARRQVAMGGAFWLLGFGLWRLRQKSSGRD
jgi:hypothetical protein